MKKYLLIIAVALAAGFTGCKKGYLDLENNPNSPSSTTPGLALAGGLEYAVSIVQGGTYAQYGVWVGYQSTSGNYVPSPTIEGFQFTNSDFNGDFNEWYQCLLIFHQLQAQAATDPTLANYQAISMIMNAYGFQHLVDNFNNVPFSQAFSSTIVTPVYDDGQTIYEALGKELDAAIALIGSSPNATDPLAQDIMFGGNMTNWVKFANSLKLRLAIRVSSKFPSDPLVKDLASTQADGYLDGTTEGSVNPGYEQLLGKENPFYGTYGYDQNGNPTGTNLFYRANEQSVDTLAEYKDPRETQIYALTQVPGYPADSPATIVRGNAFGDPNALPNSNTSTFGPGLLQAPTQNAYMMLGSESLFLQAEAANNGYITGDPETLYEAGIAASFTELGLSASAAPAYYAQKFTNVNWTTSANKEEAIIIQKWIALNSLFDFEAWNEYRRTGYPALPPTLLSSAVSKTYPTRVYYPLSEYQTNAANVAKEGTINVFTSKIFWAK